MFVVGPGRSGTSLLWALLNDCPHVQLAPETHFLDQWLPKHWQGDTRATVAALAGPYSRHRHFTQLGIDPAVLTGTPREAYTAILDACGGEVSGEKTPTNFRYLDRIFEWFPDAHVVFAVRDPRAVVASLHELDFDWAEGSTWTHVRLWRDAAVEAVRWADHPQVEVVRYEDLVADPVGLLGRLVPAVTGRAFDPAWIAHRLEGDTVTRESGALRTAGALAATRVDAWRRTFPDAPVVARKTERLMRELGYQPDGDVTIGMRARYWAGAAQDQARRAGRLARKPAAVAKRLRYRRG